MANSMVFSFALGICDVTLIYCENTNDVGGFTIFLIKS